MVTTGHDELEPVGIGAIIVLVGPETGSTVVEVAPPLPPPPFGHHGGAGGQVCAGPGLLAGEGATTHAPFRDSALPFKALTHHS